MTPISLRDRVARLSAEARQQLAAKLGAGASPQAPQRAFVATDGPTTLVAYYVSRADRELSADQLRQYLGKSLPAHMVPSLFRRIERVPRTLHGKVDTGALPDPVSATPAVSQVTEAATSEIEDQLLMIWKAVLGIKRLGPMDSFFELGGDSLLAIRLLGQIRDRWSIDLSMADLFDQPTVAGAATQIESILWVRNSGHTRNAKGGEEQEVVEF